MKALDLFCGGGGASIGLHQAGFDTIVGVDIKPHPNYPFNFVQADVLNLPLHIMDFDFVWASPPCQRFSLVTRNCTGYNLEEIENRYPNLIPAVRQLLGRHPFTCIENVPRAPLRADVVLTGKSVGLKKIDRKRHFETSFMMYYPDPVLATRAEWWANNMISVAKGSSNSCESSKRRRALGFPISPRLKEKLKAMGIPDEFSMTHAEVGEAVPPPYARFIGEHVLKVLKGS